MDLAAHRAGDRTHRGRPPKKALSPEDTFWIEVALAFGGRSPEEWQEVITPEWRDKLAKYRHQYGPFNAALRLEKMLAKTAALHFKNFDPSKLMEWPKDEPQEATLEGVFGMLKTVSKKDK